MCVNKMNFTLKTVVLFLKILRGLISEAVIGGGL